MSKTTMALLLAAACCIHSVAAQTIHAVTESSANTFMSAGKVAGRATEIVELTLQGAGLKNYQIDLYPWPRSYAIALREPNVLIYEIIRTEQRENLFKWVGELRKVHYHLYKLRSRSDIVSTTLAQAKRYTIGVVREDVREQYLNAQGFTVLLRSAKPEENFRNLLSGRVDMVAISDSDVAFQCDEAHVDCSVLEKVFALSDIAPGIYMAFSRSTPDAIVDRTRAAFDKLKADGTLKRVMERSSP